jgi:hypothetical protein
MMAAASRKMLQAMRAYEKPEVSASACVAWVASRSWVRLVAIA